MKTSNTIISLLGFAATCLAQGFGGYGGGGNPYANGAGGNDNGGSDGNPFGNSGFGGQFGFGGSRTALIAHAVLGTLAFGFFLPVGGIMIRLASFRGLWLVHGLFQIFAYLLYIAAFAIGIWMVSQRNVLINNAHPIIGIVLFVVLFFQPILGFLHHFMFKKHSRRVVWSYGHIWLGRIIITLGIINGGLGLKYARELPLDRPSNGAIIAYGVLAGVMWLLYVASIVVGERRRSRAAREARPPMYKEATGANKTQYA